MTTKYYRIESAGRGAYNLPWDGTILAIAKDGRCSLLTSAYCSRHKSEHYRQFVAGRLQEWPKAAYKAADLSTEWRRWREDYFSGLPENLSIIEEMEWRERFSAAEIAAALGLIGPAFANN